MNLSVIAIGNEIGSRYYLFDRWTEAIRFSRMFGGEKITGHGKYVLVFLNRHEYEDYLFENARSTGVVRVG